MPSINNYLDWTSKKNVGNPTNRDVVRGETASRRLLHDFGNHQLGHLFCFSCRPRRIRRVRKLQFMEILMVKHVSFMDHKLIIFDLFRVKNIDYKVIQIWSMHIFQKRKKSCCHDKRPELPRLWYPCFVPNGCSRPWPSTPGVRVTNAHSLDVLAVFCSRTVCHFMLQCIIYNSFFPFVVHSSEDGPWQKGFKNVDSSVLRLYKSLPPKLCPKMPPVWRYPSGLHQERSFDVCETWPAAESIMGCGVCVASLNRKFPCLVLEEKINLLRSSTSVHKNKCSSFTVNATQKPSVLTSCGALRFLGAFNLGSRRRATRGSSWWSLDWSMPGDSFCQGLC